MTEQLRQHYLQALGIEAYVPRQVLPGAAASPLRDSKTGADADVHPEPADPVVPAPQSLSDKLLEEQKKPVRQARAAPSATGPQPVRGFVLSAWRIADDLMVLDTRQLKLALPVEQLLLNMVSTLGLEVASLPRAELLRWPLSETAPSTGQGPADARAMVQAYLAAQHWQRPFTTLLLMGADAGRYAVSRDSNAGDGAPSPGTICDIDFGDEASARTDSQAKPMTVSAIVLPSLAAMLQKPALKAITWRAIKHLRASH